MNNATTKSGWDNTFGQPTMRQRKMRMGYRIMRRQVASGVAWIAFFVAFIGVAMLFDEAAAFQPPFMWLLD